jgi:dTMP kinase
MLSGFRILRRHLYFEFLNFPIPYSLTPGPLLHMFFSFDGIDGVGKSTQIDRFCAWLESLGKTVVRCRDPGSTSLGDAVRDILLHRNELKIDRTAEMFLYMAARAQLVNEVIQPALARGDVVVSDRYLLANVVYQGHAGGLDVNEIWRIGKSATQGIVPEMTFLLDISCEVADRRMNRPRDRMESQGAEFVQKVRTGFLAEALRNPERIAVIDADRDVEVIQKEIREVAEAILNESR